MHVIQGKGRLTLEPKMPDTCSASAFILDSRSFEDKLWASTSHGLALDLPLMIGSVSNRYSSSSEPSPSSADESVNDSERGVLVITREDTMQLTAVGGLRAVDHVLVRAIRAREVVVHLIVRHGK